jgi:hypothetical protein
MTKGVKNTHNGKKQRIGCAEQADSFITLNY